MAEQGERLLRRSHVMGYGGYGGRLERVRRRSHVMGYGGTGVRVRRAG
ncbi:hypothetical protein JOF29_001281 [Kribbella aluminosa]|uniref:Uncharacterized protein n=1 Tax=Kribbella aluminosa TaxID=416017 RepID=A0ABS4UEX0_9ACTN|nr:hypothetical protein [Kribbella aluminosa]MBP2350198.1 hypothetical protein [Kribbella aluminosa]